MNRIIVFSAFVYLFLFFNTVLIAQNKSDFPYWLEGTWVIDTKNGNSYEMWQKVSNDHLKGKVFRIFDDDTIVFDTMSIKIIDEKIIYELTATYDKKRVYAGYVLSKPSPTLWKFENYSVEYPKAINYEFYSKDSVYVWTEAKDQNTACTDFIMRKEK